MGDRTNDGQIGGVNVPGTVGQVDGDIVGRDKYQLGPSSVEIEEKAARDRLREILNQFDRRSVRDPMHEENFYFMVESLQELRVNIQMGGISTVNDPIARAILIEIREEIEEVETLMGCIPRISPRDDWADSILDYRIYGGFQEGTLIPAQTNYHLQIRLEDVQKFCAHRVESQYKKALNVDMKSRRERAYSPDAKSKSKKKTKHPLNIDRLAKDIFCLYLFGRMDQLKDRIVSKLGKIKI